MIEELKAAVNFVKYILGFILFGWIIYLYKKVESQRQKLLTKDYELKRAEVSNEIDQSSIDDLVRRNNERNEH